MGVNKLYEGITISRPSVNPLPAPLKTLAVSSSYQPCIMAVEESPMY